MEEIEIKFKVSIYVNDVFYKKNQTCKLPLNLAQDYVNKGIAESKYLQRILKPLKKKCNCCKSSQNV